MDDEKKIKKFSLMVQLSISQINKKVNLFIIFFLLSQKKIIKNYKKMMFISNSYNEDLLNFYKHQLLIQVIK